MIQKVVWDFPPLYEEIAAAFKLRRDQGIIFSWGGRVFNPDGLSISPPLAAHEAVHGARQGTVEANIVDWWKRYIDDVRFRLEEEIPAHQAEYRWFIEHGNRNQRRIALKQTAARLASPLYGRLVGVSTARDMLKRGRTEA